MYGCVEIATGSIKFALERRFTASWPCAELRPTQEGSWTRRLDAKVPSSAIVGTIKRMTAKKTRSLPGEAERGLEGLPTGSFGAGAK